MPFIWNDSDYSVLDEDFKYDKNQFKAVRKMFVAQFAPKTQFNAATIRRNFRKYGAIESIEILKSQKPAAYITFECDINALAAFLDGNREKNETGFVTEPAHTWKQPADLSCNENNLIEVDDDYIPPIFILNNDCLLTLFKYLDFDSLVNLSEVCQSFHNLLHEHRFRKVEKFVFKNFHTSKAMPLYKMTQHLRCIGKYITKLEFQCNEKDDKIALKFFEKIGKYVGENIRHADLEVGLNEERIAAIRLMLQSLITLTIHDYNDFDMNFEDCCPSLTKLKLAYCMTFPMCTKPWPKLEYLKAYAQDETARQPELQRYLTFFKHNPQLIYLKICAYFPYNIFPAIATHLTNLKKLCLWPALNVIEFDITAVQTAHLSGLQHLTKLNLVFLASENINGILQSLTRLNRLKELKLEIYGDDADIPSNQRHVVALAQKLSHLERVSFQNFFLLKGTALDYYDYIHGCNVDVTQSVILETVDVLRSTRSESDGGIPMALYIDKSIDSSTFCDEKFRKYLQVSWQCSHEY